MSSSDASSMCAAMVFALATTFSAALTTAMPPIAVCPVMPAAMEGRQIIQWDKDSCGDAGFLKIDLLGLGMLSAVERCVDEVRETRRETLDLSRIPFDDA